MDTQRAIEKVLQDFTRELLKVFSQAVVQALSHVEHLGRRTALPATSGEAAAPAKRGRPRKAAVEVAHKAAAPRKASKAAKPAAGSTGRSTQEQVNRLSERILELLRKSGRNLASAEMRKSLSLRPTDEGRFEYALNKLKADKQVLQHGERREARYSVGGAGKAKGKRGRGRPRAVAATPVAAPKESEGSAPEAAAESASEG